MVKLIENNGDVTPVRRAIWKQKRKRQKWRQNGWHQANEKYRVTAARRRRVSNENENRRSIEAKYEISKW